MSDEKKKPKIDIKARLGKTSLGLQPVALPVPGSSPGGSVPPGSNPGAAPSGVPAPAPSLKPVGIAPPPGISPGIPLPPFGPQPRRAPEPKPSAAQQTIKVEMGEEVEQERKKAKKRMLVFVTLATVAGVGFGFVIGGASKAADTAKVAQQGAADLEKAVKESTEKLTALSEKLNEGIDTFKNKKYPEELGKDLAGISIPFDATNLTGRGVGSLNSGLQSKLFGFTLAVSDLTKTKESLTNMLSIAKDPVKKSWAEATAPVFNFSVIFRGDNKGMLAELVPNKEPFEAGKDWPDSFKILRPERQQNGSTKGVEKEAKRWKKGDLTGNDPIAIPVDPASVKAFTTEQLVNKLQFALIDMQRLLEGDASDPRNEKAGLIKDSGALAAELHKVSIAK